MSAPPLTLRVHSGIAGIPEVQWEALLREEDPPALRWKWLHALEASGSASAETGWEPRHLGVWRGETLVAASPAYRKHHSMGEYIYDFAWAQAAQRMGIDYYPKLLVGVPLSPLTASRLLVLEGEEVPAMRARLVKEAQALAEAEGCSGLHFLFPPEEEVTLLEQAGLHRRTTVQFHWQNPGYQSYDDFLSRFDSKRRHQLRRERGAAAAQGIQLRTVTGAALERTHADRAHAFYAGTCERNGWGHVQLNQDFFRRVFSTLPEQVEVVEAWREGRVIGAAFNLLGKTRRYGRYWGCTEEHPFLHFNVCFYESIDACIREGRQVFEPGAGGEHKVTRGFVPTAVHSAHRLAHPRLDAAVADFLGRERRALLPELAQAEEISGMRPYARRSSA